MLRRLLLVDRTKVLVVDQALGLVHANKVLDLEWVKLEARTIVVPINVHGLCQQVAGRPVAG